MRKVHVNWSMVSMFLQAVKDKYSETKLDGVYALPRGGLVLGVMLSHRLDIPLLCAPTKNCLIVDDICDSGESLLHYFKNTSGSEGKRPFICTMFYKENDLGVVPDLYTFKKEDDWIVFPWEE